MRCYRRLFNISFKDQKTNGKVRGKNQAGIGEYEEFLTMVKKIRKLKWFGHVPTSSGLAKTSQQGTVNVKKREGEDKKWGLTPI